jgi:hypothetical protein
MAGAFAGWIPPERRITAAEILASRGCQLAEPSAPLNRLPAMPLDNWPPDTRAIRAFNERLDRMLSEAEEWVEAAE